MGGYSQQMERARVFWIAVADQPVEALGIDQTAGAMMSHCGCERLFGTAPDTHASISNAKGLTSVARPIAPEAEVDLAGAAVDPHRLIAGQRARRPIHRVTGNV